MMVLYKHLQFRILALLIFFFAGTFSLQSQVCDNLVPSSSFSYNTCTGEITMSFRAISVLGCDVRTIQQFDANYSVDGSNYTNILEVFNYIPGGFSFSSSEQLNFDGPETCFGAEVGDQTFYVNDQRTGLSWTISSTTTCGGIGCGTTTGRYADIDVVYKMPSDALSNGFTIGYGRSLINCTGGEGSTTDDVANYATQTISVRDPGKVTNLQVINNNQDCSKVSLEWNNPTTFNASSDGCLRTKWKAKIFRDGNLIADNILLFPSSGTETESYQDFGASPGVDHAYTVQCYIEYEASRIALGDESSIANGKRKSVPTVPNNISASTTNCNSTINVSWNTVVGADSYQVTWTGGGSATTTNTNYTITGINRGTNYNVQVRAINDCGNGPISTAVTGISPADPTAPTNITIGETTLSSNAALQLTWTDAQNETEYKIFKTVDGVSGTPVSVAANQTSYIDTDVQACKEYSYEIRAINSCNPNGVAGAAVSGEITLNLSGTFASNAIDASKGYYTNRVELTWTVAANNNLLEGYNIYRRLLGDNSNPSLLNTLSNPNSNIYLDYLADAGVQYEYFLVAYGECNGVNLYSDTIQTIGFRASSGVINGEVSYLGGIAVQGAKILVENVSGSNGSSLYFDGSQLAQNNSPSFDNSAFAAITVEAWLRLDGAPTGSWAALSDCELATSPFFLGGDANNFIFSVANASGTLSYSASSAIPLSALNQYVQLSGVYSASDNYVKLFLNGVLVDSQAVTLSSVTVNSLCIGDGFKGNLDELRFWNKAKTNQELANTFDVKARGTELGLKAYYDLDENLGLYAYDKSSSGVIFNKNHVLLPGANLWSSTIPTANQLAIAAYTNSSGDYNVIVPYSGVGQNFTVTPSFGTHQFNPGNRVLFIGDNSTVQNNVNFEDISSFQVTGSVLYQGTSCPVEDAFVKIDGNIVTDIDNLPIKTNALGQFDIQVPIGMHSVSVEKSGHVFSAGRFPVTGQYNFQQVVTGIMFEDSTKVKVIGRVVGGLREANKFPGLGLSNNNIGVARIIFSSQNGCTADTIFTDLNTGEYEAYVLPLRHVMDVSIPSNPSIDFGVLDLLNLSNTPPMQTLSDTLGYDSLFMAYTIDSVSYQKRLDYIYRESPSLEVFANDVLGLSLERFKGDHVLEVVDYSNTVDTTLKVSLADGQSPFLYDVFTESHFNDEDFKYKAYILAFEQYYNLDGGAIVFDTVPVSDGKIIFNNNLAIDPVSGVELSDVVTNIDELSYLLYEFQVAKPNFNANTSIPEFSYTRTMEVSLQTSSGQIIPWLPLSHPVTGLPDVYRAYILGGQNFGNSFFTSGPENVDYVLRDPPGGESFAVRSVGNAVAETESWGWNLGLELTNTDQIDVGAKFNVGFGVSTATEIEQNTSIGTSASISGGRSGFLERVVENTTEWSTNANPANIGSGSDLYIGHSTNVEFGVTDYLRLVPDSMCTYVDCIQNYGNGFAMAKTASLSVVPGGYNTGFIYTQDFIENIVLPDLINLRNIIMQSNPKYNSVLPFGDPNYGRNNDDPVFGAQATIEPLLYNWPEDFTGPSYFYNPVTYADSLTDTIRLMNQQIKLWEKAIEKNEFEKVNINNQTILDSLKNYELELLEAKYEGANAAYYALQTIGGTAAIGTAIATGLATAVAPAPGFAIAQSIGFAVTTGTGIAAVETIAKHLEYLDLVDQINDRFANLVATNHSISGGATATFTKSSTRTVSEENSFEFGASTSLGAEISGKISNTGVGFSSGLTVDFARSNSNATDSTVSNTISYTLADSDNADFFSVDVFPSMFGWGPIFKRRAGGKTGCPYEEAEVTAYYNPGTVISEATLQRDLPGLSVDQSIITNVPIDQAAVFNLTLTNLTQTGDDQPYTVTSLADHNPFGAYVNINGFPTQTPQVSAGTSINLTLTLEKGPGAVYNYDSLLVIAHSVCQYDFGISPNFKDIADSVWISVHFIPTCTDVELLNPDDNWVLNNSFEDTLPLVVGGYNINFFDLERFRVEYKPSSAANWIGLESFWKDTTGQPSYLPISSFTNFTSYDWDVAQLPDGAYDLRVSSICSLAELNSTTYSGVMDRINPHPFGTPVPADGILDANEDIAIRFNEPIDLGAINPTNFDIRGVLNQTALAHYTSLYFDGVDDYLQVSAGANIQSRDFSIEFWAKRASFGEEVLFSQGQSPIENLSIGFNAANQFSFKLGAEELNSTLAINDNLWHFYTASYNFDNETLELTIDGALVNPGNTSLFNDFVAAGALYIGKSASQATFFNGNVHELRIWNKYRTLSDIIPTINIELNKGQLGLLYNWKMDEATGGLAKDHIRNRDAQIFGAIWQVEPNGQALSFDGVDDYLELSNAANLSISDEMDFTLEFWFNSASSGLASLFSNGSGTNLYADSLISWNIEKDALGQIHVKHNGMDFLAVSNNYFDGSWHHFALVLQRTGNLSAYIDGNLQNSMQAISLKEFGGASFSLGARAYFTGVVQNVDQYFDGQVDEFRFWNTARKIEQISRDKQNRLLGDELGLIAYLPFEEYQLQLGVPVLTASLIDAADASHTAQALNGATYSSSTPTIKLQRPVQAVNFTYSVNNDQIIITPTSAPELIENVTLDITVGGIRDLRGNVMQSPKTWIAYIDKNQVIWQDDAITLTKDFGANLSFSSAVLNTGGAAKTYTISNLPEWLSASQNTGSIAPNAVQTINFTIDPNTNIGDYTEDIHLTTDFGYPEKLALNLKVRDQEPNWTVDPAAFQYSMNVVGYLQIEGVVSTDNEDILAAFVNNEVRGAAHLQYISSLDRYLVFLDVYSNLSSGENLSFKIWDASTGSEYIDVVPSLVFAANQTIGSLNAPQLFEAGNSIVQNIPLSAGWNWIAFNLLSEDSLNLAPLLSSYSPDANDELKAQSEFSNFTNSGTWVGPLSVTGVRPELGYRLRVANADTLELEGSIIDPTTRIINLNQGWTWIGFISIRNQEINQALGNLNPTSGDLIKGKSQFAIYDTNLGWIGSLNAMIPGRSYMYQSAVNSSFTFPFAGAFKSDVVPNATLTDNRWPINNGAYSSNMTHIVSLQNCDLFWEDMYEHSNWILGVFDKQNNCRALSRFDLVANTMIAFVTIAGDQNDDLEYRLLNLESAEELIAINHLKFTSNELKGSLTSPYMLELSEEDCRNFDKEKLPTAKDAFLVYPNLFEENLNVEYISATEAEVTISLYNNLGQVIYTQVHQVMQGMNTLRIDFKKEAIHIPAGTYFFELSNELNDKKRAQLIRL
ncbi:MAG: LamG-like jellyroll fold domain-containing protein [Chitinophagales bacterium]